MYRTKESSERAFGHHIFTWKIENFNYVVWKDKKYELKSLKFSITGPESMVTTWELSLEHDSVSSPSGLNNSVASRRLSFKRGSLMLHLVRLDPEPYPVWVDWRLRYFRQGKQLVIAEREVCFDRKRSHGQDLGIISDFEVESLFTEPLIFVSQMIVFMSNSPPSETFGSSLDPDLIRLSQDLKSVLRQNKFYDLELKVEDKSILVNKAMLYSRSENFEDSFSKEKQIILSTKIAECDKIIDEFVDYSEIKRMPECETDGMLKFTDTFTEEDFEIVYWINAKYEGLLKTVGYLYSGDVTDVIHKPSIAVHDVILIMKLHELEEYFTPARQKLLTKIQAQELKYTFCIEKDSIGNAFCSSSNIFTNESCDSSWKIKIFPRGLSGEEETVIVAVEKVEGNFPSDICVQCALPQSSEHLRSWTTLEWLENEEMFQCNLLMDRVTLFKSLEEDSLRLDVKITMNTYNPQNIVMELTERPVAYPKVKCIEDLVKQMTLLRQDGKYADLILQNGNEEKNLHKFILSARSGVFSSLLEECEVDRLVTPDIKLLSTIKPHILEILIDYIYSANLMVSDPKILMEVCEAAEKLEITSLSQNLCRVLRENSPLKQSHGLQSSLDEHESTKQTVKSVKSKLSDMCKKKLQEELMKYPSLHHKNGKSSIQTSDVNVEATAQTDKIKVESIATNANVEEGLNQAEFTNEIKYSGNQDEVVAKLIESSSEIESYKTEENCNKNGLAKDVASQPDNTTEISTQTEKTKMAKTEP